MAVSRSIHVAANDIGNSTQYSVIVCMGKESKKKKRVDACINVCVSDSLYCTPETNTKL